MPCLRHTFWLSLCLCSGLLQAAEALTSMTAMTVSTSTVSYQPYARPIRTSGMLSYKSQQTLSFKTAGPIAQLLVGEGDRITEGQLLAELTLEEINAQVDEARARLEMAQHNLGRISRLHQSNVVSLDQLQSAETERAVAESRLRIARFNRKYSRIKAPSPGLVLRRLAEENEQVTQNQPVIIVADTSQGWILRTGLSDEDIVRVKKGDRASITFDAWPEEIFQGKVTRLAALADEQTGTFQVEISFPETSTRLRSGFIGRVTLYPATSTRLALVPVTAVVNVKDYVANVFVYDPDDRSVSSRAIQLDFMEPGIIASSSGLHEGEIIVTTGASFLQDGAAVMVRQHEEQL